MFAADALGVQHFEIIFLSGDERDWGGLLSGCNGVLEFTHCAAIGANRDEVGDCCVGAEGELAIVVAGNPEGVRAGLGCFEEAAGPGAEGAGLAGAVLEARSDGVSEIGEGGKIRIGNGEVGEGVATGRVAGAVVVEQERACAAEGRGGGENQTGSNQSAVSRRGRYTVR